MKVGAAARFTRFIPLLDWSVVVLVLLAASVYFFGGFRAYLGTLRVSVRSADRLLVLALLLTIVRHALVRSPSFFETLQYAWQRVASSPAIRAAWPPFASTRAAVLVTGYLAVVTVGYAPEAARFTVAADPLANLLARWDAAWYLAIAQQGYQWNGNPQIEQSVVFFPAYPLAMRVFAPLVGRDFLLAGTVLSLAAFVVALAYLFRLARELMAEERARSAVWLLAAYPFAVYFSAPYTESFYLLGAVGTFFHLQRREYWRAAGWACFLALCRPNGFFIALPAAIFIGTRVWTERRIEVSAVAALIAPAVGVLSYSAYLYWTFGDPLAWMKGQQAWGRVYVGIGPGMYALFFDRFNVIANEGLTYYITVNPYDFIYSCTALFVLASLWPCARRFGLPYTVFVAINILPPLLMGGMMSIGRMTSVLFPSFLWLASVLNERQAFACSAAFAVLQGLVAVLFFTWRPVF